VSTGGSVGFNFYLVLNATLGYNTTNSHAVSGSLSASVPYGYSVTIWYKDWDQYSNFRARTCSNCAWQYGSARRFLSMTMQADPPRLA